MNLKYRCHQELTIRYWSWSVSFFRFSTSLPTTTQIVSLNELMPCFRDHNIDHKSPAPQVRFFPPRSLNWKNWKHITLSPQCSSTSMQWRLLKTNHWTPGSRWTLCPITNIYTSSKLFQDKWRKKVVQLVVERLSWSSMKPVETYASSIHATL